MLLGKAFTLRAECGSHALAKVIEKWLKLPLERRLCVLEGCN